MSNTSKKVAQTATYQESSQNTQSIKSSQNRQNPPIFW